MTDDSLSHDELPDLLALVAKAFQAGDPVPDSVVARGGSYVRWAAADADIGLIVDVDDLVPTRSSGVAADEIHFQASTHRIDLTFESGQIFGSIAPWEGGSAAIEFDGGRIEFVVDVNGDFSTDVPDALIVRFDFESHQGRVITEWCAVNRDRSS